MQCVSVRRDNIVNNSNFIGSSYTHTSWIQYGLPDLVYGLAMALTGILFVLGFSLHPGSSLTLAVPLLWGLIFVVARWCLIQLKQRYALSGSECEPFQKPRWKRIAFSLTVTVVTLAVFCAALFTIHRDHLHAQAVHEWTAAIGPLASIVFAFAYLYSWSRYRWIEGIWLAGVCLAAGAWMYRFRAGFVGIAWLLLAAGGTQVLIGAWRFIGFTKSHSQ